MNIKLGMMRDDEELEMQLVKNIPSSLNKNFLTVAVQGTGKTNFLMLITYKLYKAYLDTKGEYGAIPIIMSPLMEFTNLKLPSKRVNLEPFQEPEGIDCLCYTWKVAHPPNPEDVEIIGFKFSKLTPEDICSIANYSGDKKILGHTKKLLRDLKETNPNYNIDDFIKMIEERKQARTLYDAFYYIFTTLKEDGLFDEDVKEFDWLEALKQKKPIVFSFGDINDKELINTLSGYLLRTLWDTSTLFYNAYQKKLRKQPLTPDEEFLIENFTIALILEESHQIIYNTNSSILRSFPAHYYLKNIIDLMGRKRNFKYNFLITQRAMDLYFGFRRRFHYLLLGSSVLTDDKEWMYKALRVNRKYIDAILKLPKYWFSFTDLSRYHSKRAPATYKFKPYLSPCGMPQ